MIAGSVMAFLGSLWYQKKAQTGFLGALTSFFLLLPFSAVSVAFLESDSDFGFAIELVSSSIRLSNGAPELK